VDELIYLLVDIVSKNGNLLLDVGPEADGTVPTVQMKRLQALGAWLQLNGEAIYGTHPWKRRWARLLKHEGSLHTEGFGGLRYPSWPADNRYGHN
jgi:alpha-L-fucosidase